MTDQRPDRRAYLASVAARLRLPGPLAEEIIEEVEAHIVDATASLVDDGLAPDRAEREAIARLGDPGELGDGLRRARQTRRRLLSAVGYGAWAAINGLAWSWLFGYVLFVVASVVASLILMATVSAAGMSTSGFSTGSAWVGAGLGLFGLVYAGHRVPIVMAARSRRPAEVLQRPVAVVGAALVGGVAIFGYHGAMDATLVVTLLLAPAAFATGALLVGRIPADASGRIRLRGRSILALIALSTAALLVIGLLAVDRNPDDGLYLATTRPIGDAIDLPLDVSYGGGGGDGVGIVGRELSFDGAVPAGWSDLRLEGWLGQDDWSDDRGYLVPGQTAPIVVTPMLAGDDPSWLHAELALPVTKQRRSYVVAVTALDADGRRVVLIGPGRVEGPPWTGNAWRWLTTP